MTDRELLERAAKAAGYADAKWQDMRGWGEVRYGLSEAIWTGEDYWNPLEDDGAALRLAVKLRMSVEPWGSGAAAVVEIGDRAMVVEPHYGDDPERATRRAIVRAAAALVEPA